MKQTNKSKYVVELVDNVTGRTYWAGDGDSYPTKSSAQALADKYPKRYTATAIKLTASSENPYAQPIKKTAEDKEFEDAYRQQEERTHR